MRRRTILRCVHISLILKPTRNHADEDLQHIMNEANATFLYMHHALKAAQTLHDSNHEFGKLSIQQEIVVNFNIPQTLAVELENTFIAIQGRLEEQHKIVVSTTTQGSAKSPFVPFRCFGTRNDHIVRLAKLRRDMETLLAGAVVIDPGSLSKVP